MFIKRFRVLERNSMPVELFISVTAAFLIVVLVISFLAKRISDANRILTIPKPMRRDDALWTTKQDNSLIAYIVVQVNKFQKIENTGIQRFKISRIISVRKNKV